MKKCPYCAEEIQDKAIKCKHCGEWLQDKETVNNIDENTYKAVTIGNQIWMAENLKVTHYRNGDSIPNITDNDNWANTEEGAYCNYDNKESNVETYGRLYNWFAVDDKRGLAPKGWHIPTDDEIKQLEMYLGMTRSEADNLDWRGTNEGSKLAGRADLWNDGILSIKTDPVFGTSGFDFLPGGYRFKSGDGYSYMGTGGYFWSSTELSNNDAWIRRQGQIDSQVMRYCVYKKEGLSIRCLKD